MLPLLAYLNGKATDFLFPRWCVGCGREGKLICYSCLKTLTPIQPPICPGCGRPQSSGRLCSGCSSHQSSVDGIRSPFTFEGNIRRAVHEFKYRNLRALAPELAGLLHRYLVANPVPGDVLVPVPLHPSRLRERGYNQSLLLARELGKLCGLPVLDGSIIRSRRTAPQARTASVAERAGNISGAFACVDHRLKDRRVLLIDDVSTSGSTLEACASAARQGGALAAWGLVIAREI